MTDRGSQALRSLLAAQFCSAFNDNAWKLLVVFLAMRGLAARLGEAGAAFEAASQRQATWAFVTFTLPFLVCSLPAGTLADRLSKRTVILGTRWAELLLMAGGTVALWLDPVGGVIGLVVLGLMGLQSALFSPAKYGILPEIVPHERLAEGNGLLEMWTFVAIIAGTAAGGVVLTVVGTRTWLAGLGLTLCATIGLRAALRIPAVGPARGEGGVGLTIGAAWAAVRGTRVLWLAVLGASWFWAVASLLGQDILVYAKAFLRLSDLEASALLAAFGLGVGAGSLLAGRLSGGKVEHGLIPLGALGLGAFSLTLALLAPGFGGSLALMALMGVSSGFLVVPIDALIQWHAPSDRRGSVIALANTFVFAGILAGSLTVQALSLVGLSARQILLGAALLTLGGTAWALWLLPDALLRLVLILLTHTVYRLRVIGRAHVPETGGALLVPNHGSFVDGLFLLATLDRPVRFIMDASYYEHPLLRPFVHALGAIPISSTAGLRVVLRALRDAGRYLDAGDLVCIFAEGQVTRLGTLLPFRRGLERIVKGRSAPIVPVHLDGVWGSIFSFAGRRFVTKWPERIPYPVTVSFGAPLGPGVSLHAVRQAVQELEEAAWRQRKATTRPLHRSFVRLARRHPASFGCADASRGRLSRLRVLAGSVALARALRRPWRGQARVGILLPPSVPAALVNLAAALSGRATVNLNYTAGAAGMASAARQAGLSTVVTSRTFLLRAKVEVPEGVEPVWLEEVAAGVGRWARWAALAVGVLAPVSRLERWCGAERAPSVDDILTVIFSSGSTGEPKGVLLTHANVAANVAGAAQVFGVTAGDRLLGVLPFFHSFGSFLLWFAATRRPGIVFHPSPLDTVAIGALVERYRVTFLLATPTFLQLYLRRCPPTQFGSLRVVLTGAEKLPARLAQAFEDHFGIRPLEGYGTTECAPVVATSVPDYRAPGLFQPGSHRGFVGRPLPGVSVRIVDPDTGAPLPPDIPGLLLVRGPNVMKGYLGRDDLTAQVLRDGWYVTGDIAVVDEDGFLKITDRLSRFSKIGGEMVPHGRVEEALHEAAEALEPVFAVTAVPDEKKGERLVVLHTLDEPALPGILERLAAGGLPNLFLPRLDGFVRVEQLPVLGSGKLDLRAVRQTALERLGPRGTS